MDQGTKRLAARLLAGNPDKPPAFLGPRRPGKPQVCWDDDMTYTSWQVHRDTGFHKRAAARQRAARAT